MNEQAKKIEQQNPIDYGPKIPEILTMAKNCAPEVSVSYDDPANPLKKLELIQLPKLILAGIAVRYPMQGQADGSNPPLWKLWDEFKDRQIKDILSAVPNGFYTDAPMGIYYDMNKNDDGCFSYAVGFLMNEGAAIPEKYMIRVMDPVRVACGWFRYRSDEDIWALNPHGVVENFKNENTLTNNADGWCAEAYHDELCNPGEECMCYMIC